MVRFFKSIIVRLVNYAPLCSLHVIKIVVLSSGNVSYISSVGQTKKEGMRKLCQTFGRMFCSEQKPSLVRQQHHSTHKRKIKSF